MRPAVQTVTESINTWTDTDRRLAQTLSGYWVRFATAGNPNGEGLPAWPPYDAAAQHLEVGETVAVKHGLHDAAFEFWDTYFARARRNRAAAAR